MLPGLTLASGAEEGCTITAAACKNFPGLHRKQFRDSVGEEHLSAATNDAACLKRAEDFHHWCGNSDSAGGQVAATFNSASLTQVYHPGACEAGWSQWDAFCYKHYWEMRNWFEAEKLCRDRNSHLASVHSQAENRFIATLTKGLSVWIGYSDLDQNTHFQWTDSTQDDFSNFAKNCTGRETEPDCKPEERQQQWYDWEGGDAGTFVCKRNALLPVALLNVSAGDLLLKPWSSLLPALESGRPIEANVSSGLPVPPQLKTTDDLLATSGAAGSKALPVPEPKLVAPRTSLF